MRLALALSCAALGAGVALPLLPSAALAQTSDVVIENLTLRFGEGSYRAPRAEFRGTTLSRGEIARILDPGAPEPLADRVRKLNAASIVMPEVISEVTTAQGRQVTTYRDTLFTNVANGRIASVSSAGGSIESGTDKGSIKGSFGRMAVEDLDLDLAIGLFTAGGSPDASLKRVYGAFSVDGLTFNDPASGIVTRIGRLFGRDLSARPTRAGWIGTVNAMTATSDLKTATPEARDASLTAMAELFDSFALASLEASDISFGPTTGDDGKGRIGRMAFLGSSGTRAAEFRLDGFEAGSKDTRVRFSSLSFGGLSIKPWIEAMRTFGDGPDGKPSPAALRKMIPALGSMSLSGLDVDIPGEKTGPRRTQSPPMRVSLGQVELAADKPIDGIPSDMRFAVRNVAFRLPPNPDNDGLKQLAGLGYEQINASLAMSLGWNEGGQELVIREFSLDGADMGGAILRGVVGNVSRDLFNPDSAVASVAALGATAKSVELGIENRGLFERIVAREARRQKRSPEEIRREYGMAAAVGIPAILGNSAGAKTLAQAVAKFVAKPGRLVVTARAKQPTGYGVADFAAGPDPAAIFNALDITATAE